MGRETHMNGISPGRGSGTVGAGTTSRRPVAAGAVALAAAVLCTGGRAGAAPTLRHTVDQKGDFVVVGNTLGHDCDGPVPAPVVGIVGNCGASTGDSSPDVFWRANQPGTSATASTAITAATARSTAILALPAGAVVTYARLYWSAARSGATNDTTVTVSRMGAGAFSSAVTADGAVNATSMTLPHTYYQSSADVTALVQLRGPGAYRVGGVDSIALGGMDDRRLYVAWTLVVFYRLDSDPPRNLTLFDGLDIIEPTRPMVTVSLSGFLVPAAGFDAKLAVIAYEGDNDADGDSLAFNGTTVSNALNPAANFFNSTRSRLGAAVSVAGDLPRLTGTGGSQSGYDQDVVDVTALLRQGDTQASIRAASDGDFFVLGAFVTSISTFKPDFTSTNKTWGNLSRTDGNVRPGDVLEYTVTTTNTGNDPGVGVVLTDALPAGLTFVPGSIRVVSGANPGVKTDAAGDDQGEYLAATRTITVRLGTGATATAGGTIAVGASVTVAFRVTVNADASGNIANQAVVTAGGRAGAPPAPYPSDGNGPAPGAPPTSFPVGQCATSADCPPGRVCDTAARPAVCVGCRSNADCGGVTPFCSPMTATCVACAADGPPSCSDPARPACQRGGALAGACTECSATNATRCGGAKPQCLLALGLCGCSAADGDAECGGPMSGVICNAAVAGICVPGCSEAPMRNRCPAGQTCAPPGAAVGTCVAAGACNGDGDCAAPRPRCDLAAAPRACVQCLTGAHCPPPQVCEPVSKTCVECTPASVAACATAPAGTRCLATTLTCGCQADADCGGAASGRVCDPTISKCVVGCRGGGGNGCPPGSMCTSATMAVGQCVPRSDGGGGGTGGADGGGPIDAPGVDLSPADGAREAGTGGAGGGGGGADGARLDGAPGGRDGGGAGGAGGAGGGGIDAPITDGSAGAGGSRVVGRYVAGGGCRCDAGRAGGDGTPASGLAAIAALAMSLLIRRRSRR
jgi:uncharacterized repeat protein (TIGR01451 family)